MKQLLDKSRLKSAKLSRLVVAKSRELKDTRKEVSRVPQRCTASSLVLATTTVRQGCCEDKTDSNVVGR